LRRAQLRCTRRADLLLALVAFGLTLLLAVGQSLRLTHSHPTAQLDLAAPEARLLVRGFHEPEQDGVRHFRWTAGTSHVRLANAGFGESVVLGLRIGASPPSKAAPNLHVVVNGQALTTLDLADSPQRYLLLVPSSSVRAGEFELTLASTTTVLPPDVRALGVRLEQVTLDVHGTSVVLPGLLTALTPGLLLASVMLSLRRIGCEPLVVFAALALAATGVALAQQRIWPLAPMYVGRMAVAAAMLTGLTLWLLPVLERRAQWAGAPAFIHMLWAAALLACAVRFVGTLYPPFDAYDLSLNLGRFLRTVGGTLVDTNRSFEFRSGVTVYPAGPYLALAPGALLGLTPKLAVQGGIALVDGFGGLATGLLARRLGLTARSALFAAVLYAALPVALTSLWFGHTAQVFGQALMVPLALVLLAALGPSGRRWHWLVAGALLSMALLSHIGVTILAAVWLGLAWLLLGRTLDRARWGQLFGVLVVSGAVGLALVYGAAAQLKVAETIKVGERVAEATRAPAYNLIWSAIVISFYAAGWALAPGGLLLVLRERLPRGGGALLAAWLVTAGIFLTVELATALQVRYLVFLAPLACVGIGAMFGALEARGRAGRGVVWVAIGVLLVLGAIPWFSGVYENIQPSMTPLLR
jgi:hypothetical protein